LDIKKAFDSVSHKVLLKKLEHYDVRGTANLILESYLSERKQYVSISNYNSTSKLDKYKVPQGSTLGLLLFLTYINDLPSCLQTVSRFFADDTALSIIAKTLLDMEALANSELCNVFKCMLTNGLVVNIAKTEALI